MRPRCECSSAALSTASQPHVHPASCLQTNTLPFRQVTLPVIFYHTIQMVVASVIVPCMRLRAHGAALPTRLAASVEASVQAAVEADAACRLAWTRDHEAAIGTVRPLAMQPHDAVINSGSESTATRTTADSFVVAE